MQTTLRGRISPRSVKVSLSMFVDQKLVFPASCQSGYAQGIFGKSEISFKGECGRRRAKLQKLPFSLLGDNLFLERLLCSRNLPSHITTHLRLKTKFISEMLVR